MDTIKRFLQILNRVFPLIIALAALFYIFSILSAPAHAQSGICIKNVSSNLLHNGIVANGTAISSTCAVGPVWPGVAPAELLPIGSQPNGYLYLAYHPSSKRLFIGIDTGGDDDLSDQDVVYVLFDATNDNVFNAGDFYIKVKVSTANTAPGINSGTLCTQSTGVVEYFRWDGNPQTDPQPGGWVLDNTSGVASAINAKAAYDYDITAADPESKIWNLEIDMPVGLAIGGTTYFNLNTTTPDSTGAFFGIGAYVFVDRGHQTIQDGTVLKWPMDMAGRSISQQDMGFPVVSMADQLADAKLQDVCFDVNYTVDNPWTINNVSSGPQDYSIQRNGINTFGVTFYFDGPGNTAATLTNNGNVRLGLTPYRASGAGTAWNKSQPVDAGQYNHSKRVDFVYDFAQPDTSFGSTGDINFICADAYLENFEHDDNTSNNSIHLNLNYFVTSGYTQEFNLFGSSLPNLKPGESTRVLLYMPMTNDLREGNKHAYTSVIGSLGSLMPNTGWLSLLAICVIVFLISFKLHRAPKMKKYARALMVLALLIISACPWLIKPTIGTDRWEIKNARELGIRPVKGERDWYEMPIKYGETKRVALEFRGKPLPYKTVKHELKPTGSDGNPSMLHIPVKPGQVMTVIAFGQVDMDGPDGPLEPTSPTGFIQLKPALATHSASDRYLLSSGYYSPNEYAGALIGSFDNFETSFVVGRNTSVIVPEKAKMLSLAVNAMIGSYGSITGAYEIFIIDTPAPSVPTHTSIRGDATYHIPRKFNIWDVLTTLHVYTYYETTDVDERGAIRSRTRHPWGDAHYSIYDSHVDRVRGLLPPFLK